MAKRVSSIYGNALFELAVEEKKVDALLSEVQTLQQILLENADLLSLLNHPEVSKIEKLDLLKNIFSGRASDEVLGFLSIIVEKDRQKDIPKIFEFFVDKAKEYKGIGKVKVVSATELSARQKEKLTKRLLETTKYTSFEVDYQIDPALLGGLIIRIEDRVLDSSLKTQIEKLSKGFSKLSVEIEGVVGLGKYKTSDLPVGTVSSVKKASDQLGQEIRVKPKASLDVNRYVLLIGE